MPQIILASASPRRKQLLEQIGVSFKIIASDYQEDMTLKMKPLALAKHLSKGKAMAVAKLYPNYIIIAADTFVSFNDQILGKPGTPAKATKTLKMINNNSVDVITGFTVINGKTIISRAVNTKVFIKSMTESEIKAYVQSGEPLDKAGAFGIQGKGALIVKKISGDYNNIVGLPLYDLAIVLAKVGVKVL